MKKDNSNKNKVFDDFLNESNLSRIFDKTQKYSCGSISAFMEDRTHQENDMNYRMLCAYLTLKDYSLTRIDGTYIKKLKTPDTLDANKKSLFVCNYKVDGDDGGELEKDLVKMGEYFGQDSILIIPVGGKDAYLRGTSQRENAYPRYEQKEIAGNGKYDQAAGQFVSEIRDGKFTFEHIDKPRTVNGFRGMHILLKKFDNI